MMGVCRPEAWGPDERASQVFDVTSRRSFQNLEKWMDEVAKYAQGSEPLYASLGLLISGFLSHEFS